MKSSCALGKAKEHLPRILCVDDNILFTGIITPFLSDSGYEVETVATEEEALSRITGHERGYDLIIADSGIGGPGLIAALRAISYPARIIATCIDITPEHLKRYQELRVDRILKKPMDLSELLGAVQALVAQGKDNGSI
jgi:DNA-binding response OmpR family regulator